MVINNSDRETRIISLQGGINFRDLGGYVGADGRRIRWRRLFRSGSTHVLSDADRRSLADLGIRTAVDLRSNQERQEHPHGLAGQNDVLYRGFDHNRAGGNLLRMLEQPQLEATHLHEGMVELYRELPYEFGDIYQQLFRTVAAGPLPLVFNCAAGKDRTGVAAALLLNALGVNWENIVADYLLSEQFVPDIIRIFRGTKAGQMLGQIDPLIVAPLFSVDRAYLEAMRGSIIARNGSFQDYYGSQLGLEPEIIERLRMRLLD
jgi:protein-tyrosine phosphatase